MLCLWFQERVAWGFLGVVFWILRGVFLVQYLLDRQTWKHQQNSCLLHFVSTLLKQTSSVYMFCVNKQHCTYTHKHNLQIIYFSSWEEQLGKVSSISYLLGSESRSNTCQVFWILMLDSQILTNNIVALCLLPAQLPCKGTEQYLDVCSSD